MTNPIPPHLAARPWYARHMAWLRSIGLVPHHDPGDALPARADLARADLRGAVLRDADMTGAVMTGADMTGADMTGADLARADLRGADLRDAVLRDADLARADLRGAVLRDADLARADMTGADMTGADLRDAVGIASEADEAAALDAAIAEIRAHRELWDQSTWHGQGYDPATAPEVGACGTVHCLAGWLQALTPLDSPLRKIEAVEAGIRLAPRAYARGWFGSSAPADLLAAVERGSVGGGK